MPKKTKREKLHAETIRNNRFQLHHSTQIDKSSELVKGHFPLTNNIPITSPLAEYKYDKLIDITTKNQHSPTNYSFVINDLVRITIFTLIAIGIQIVLYFLLRTR